MLECGTECGDEVTFVQRPMDRGHKICFTMAVSTIYPAVSTVDGDEFIVSHCHALQQKNTKYVEAGISQAGVYKMRVRRPYGGWTVSSRICSS